MQAKELTQLRTGAGLTKQQLAAALGLGPSGRKTIYRWEGGLNPIPGPAAIAIRAIIKGDDGE